MKKLMIAVLTLGLALSSCSTAEDLGSSNASTNIPIPPVATGSEDINNNPIYESQYNSISELRKNSEALAKEIVSEGAVLLKNDNNALPLNKDKGVNIIGFASYYPNYSGKRGRVFNDNELDINSFSAFKLAGINYNNDLYELYQQSFNDVIRDRFCAYPELEASYLKAYEESISSFSDTIIYQIARTGGESVDIDHSYGNDFLKLSDKEMEILSFLSEMKDSNKIKKVILVINSANPLNINVINNYEVDAIINIGVPGEGGLLALPSLLMGDISPSGHLTDTWYLDPNYSPGAILGGENAYTNISDHMVKRKAGFYNIYKEGIYNGYRYTETKYLESVINKLPFNYENVVAYPFGYGMSYTNFKYSDFKAKLNGSFIEGSLNVKNIGNVCGRDTVEIYVNKPFTDIEVPAIELIGYERTSLLKPGKSEAIKFKISLDNLKTYDMINAKGYVILGGSYNIAVGHDSHDAINNILASLGKTKADGMDNNGDSSLSKAIKLNYDSEGFSKSKETGKKITNSFSDKDINKIDSSYNIKYLSRHDFNMELKKDSLAINDKVLNEMLAHKELNTSGYTENIKESSLTIKDLKGLSYDDKKYSELINSLSYMDLKALISFGLEKFNPLPKIDMPEFNISNSASGITKLYSDIDSSLANIKNDPDKMLLAYNFPSPMLLAQSFSNELAESYGYQLAEEATWAGVNALYAPSIEIHRTPYAGRLYSSYSEDPLLTGSIAGYEIDGMHVLGINAFLSGIGTSTQETERQSVQSYIEEQALREIYLRATDIAVSISGCKNIVLPFSRLGTKYLTEDSSLINGFLRDEIGIMGIITTDIYMVGYDIDDVAYYIAGGLTNITGEIPAYIFEKYENSPEFRLALLDSAHRIIYQAVNSNLLNS